MKKKPMLLYLFLSLVFQTSFAQIEAPIYSYDDLKPTETQQKVETFVTQFLGSYHFKKFNVDDELSKKVWNGFILDVDRSKAYFTKNEVDDFKKFETTIDESLLTGDLTAPFIVFNQYRQKYKARHEKIIALVNTPFDFSIDESFEPNREKAEWATSDAELDEVWRKIIKSQALSMKLSGTTDSAIVANLTKRYNMYETRMAKLRSEDVFQVFMNSFSEVLDPHTSYMIPSTAAQFNIDMSQSLEGIGASLRNEGEYVTIVDIIPGGPLFKSSQSNKGDKILAVAQGDDEFQDIIGWLTDDAVKIIRGKKGTKIRLKLLAEDAPITAQPREVVLIREKIKLEEAVATSEIIPVKNGRKTYNIGVIDLPMFYRDFNGARNADDFQSTTKDIKKFLDEYKTKNVDAVVLDLRNNGGGSLTEAIDLTGLFIEKGPVVQRSSFRRGTDVEEDKNSSVSYAGPLVVLQNRFSASASEIFSGAIQDYKRGLIVGERSFGKATVQQLVDLDQYFSTSVASRNNRKNEKGDIIEESEKYGQLKLTTEKFYRITGKSNQRIGVMPDVTLPSPFNPDETGESAYPTALPNDAIETTFFKETTFINGKKVAKVQSQLDSRIAKSDVWNVLLTDFEKYKSLGDDESYSLNLEIREKEKKESDVYFKSIKKMTKTSSNEKHEDDIHLLETLQIASDLAELK